MEFRYHLGEIESVAQKIVDNLSCNILLFYGEMGSGKTSIIKSIVSALGCEDPVTSPTYSLVNEYRGDDVDIYHFDLYRIKNEKEALDFGFEDYLDNKDIILIEWPEKVLGLIPNNVDVITILTNDDASRTLKLNQNLNLTDKKLMMPQNFY